MGNGLGGPYPAPPPRLPFIEFWRNNIILSPTKPFWALLPSAEGCYGHKSLHSNAARRFMRKSPSPLEKVVPEGDGRRMRRGHVWRAPAKEAFRWSKCPAFSHRANFPVVCKLTAR